MKRHAAATERNRAAIADVLGEALPERGTVLEIASGTGQHCIYFAARFPYLTWQPSDVSPAARASIRAWADDNPHEQILPPLDIDVRSAPWPVETTPPITPVTAILNINMIHISSFETCIGLFAGAARILPVDGLLFLYGPYKINGAHTAPSNAAFDESLRSQNPAWGVRDMDEVADVGARHGFGLYKKVAMPANNFSLLFRKETSRDR